MAIIKPSERFSTHKIGSSSDPTKPVGKDDYVIVESADATKYPDQDDRVRVAKQRDIIEDYFGMIQSKNLFDKSCMIKDGYYVDINYWDVRSAPNWGCSDFVPVLPQTAYILTNPQYLSCDKIYYNSSKQKIGYGSGASFTTPENCYYIRFTLYKATNKSAFGDGSGVQLEQGSTATDVVEYYKVVALDSKGIGAITTDKLARVVNVANSDKIAFFGSSYTESAYAIKNKSWVNKIAQFTDWILANYGSSGNRLTDEVTRLRANTKLYHSTLGIYELNPSIISFSNIGNETLDDLPNLDMYRQELLYAYQHVRARGAELIIGTEHLASRSIEMLLTSLAKELGIDVVPIGALGTKICSTGYPGFWGGGHPATRTNAHLVMGWLNYINALPRPQRSIKVFRVRSEYKGGSPSVEQLAYDTIQQRMRVYQEIGCGEKSLNPSSGEEYYDRLDESYAIQAQTNEYLDLIAKNNVACSNFVLVEFVIDRLNTSAISLYVKCDTEPTNVYLANNNSVSTQYTESKKGNAFEVTKAVYDAFTYAAGQTFTSTITGSEVLTYEGKAAYGHLKGSGYWLWFSGDSIAASGGSGTLTHIATSATSAYLSCDAAYGRHRFPLFSNWEKPWSRFEDASAYTTYTDGYIKVTLPENHRDYVQYDKIRLLIAKSGTFNITDPYAIYEGGVDKTPTARAKYALKVSGQELNKTYAGTVETGFPTDWKEAEGGMWTAGVAPSDDVKQMPSGVRDYPSINANNRHIELGYDATDGFPTKIQKSFVLPSTNRGFVSIIVRVVARLFPKIYNTTVPEDEYHTHTQQIKSDSYDIGTLVCAISNNEIPFAISKKPVDIGWGESCFEFELPISTDNALTVILYRDESDKVDTANYRNHLYPMQIYDVSVQVDT